MDKHNGQSEVNEERQPYDVVIIGAGVSGLGVAMAASRRGLKTLVLERATCGQATSANSLRIIHGGFRYLQSLNLSRARTSCVDQDWLLKEKPDYIKPLACLMPLDKFGLKSKFPVWLATKLYGIVRPRDSTLPLPRTVDVKALTPDCKILEPHAPHGALLWHDALLTSPAEFTQNLVSDLQSDGVELREHSDVQSIEEQNGVVMIQSHQGGRLNTIRSRGVVVSAGPWLPMFGAANPKAWCLGFNIVTDTLCEENYAIGLKGSSGRLFFLVPRFDGSRRVSVLGTGYLHHHGSPDAVNVPEGEVSSFMEEFNRLLPQCGLSSKNISRIESGVLPAYSRCGELRLYGRERVIATGRIVRIMSTKYTTFRSQGELAISKLVATF